MKAILVIVENYHYELWLDGRYDTHSGLLSVRVLILRWMLLLLVGSSSLALLLYFPAATLYSMGRLQHNIIGVQLV